MKRKSWLDLSPEEALKACFDVFLSTKEKTPQIKFESEKSIVSTLFAPDTGLWETAVSLGKVSWTVVERYESKEKAIEGHRKWADQADSLDEVTDIEIGRTQKR